MIKVKNGRYQMPPFIPEIQDLISRMIVVDPLKRLTISQIKQHPAFRIGLPTNCILPTPLPLPFLTEPIDTDSLDPNIFTVLIHLGYANEEEIKADLQSSSHNMTKVFCYIMTSSFSFESLPWDENKAIMPYASEEFLVDSHNSFINDSSSSGNVPAVKNISSHSSATNIPLKASLPPLSPGSPDLFSSFVEKNSWSEENEPKDKFEGTANIDDIKIPMIDLITGIQQILVSHHYKYFYPNDFTLILKHPDDNMYILIIASDNDDSTISLSIQHKNGSMLLFSAFIQMIQDFINSYS